MSMFSSQGRGPSNRTSLDSRVPAKSPMTSKVIFGDRRALRLDKMSGHRREGIDRTRCPANGARTAPILLLKSAVSRPASN